MTSHRQGIPESADLLFAGSDSEPFSPSKLAAIPLNLAASTVVAVVTEETQASKADGNVEGMDAVKLKVRDLLVV